MSVGFTQLGRAGPVRVRKAHRCDWCGERIPAGSVCYGYRGAMDGTVHTYRMHDECGAAMRRDRHVADEGFPPYGMARGCSCEAGRCDCDSVRMPYTAEQWARFRALHPEPPAPDRGPWLGTVAMGTVGGAR